MCNLIHILIHVMLQHNVAEKLHLLSDVQSVAIHRISSMVVYYWNEVPINVLLLNIFAWKIQVS